MDIALGLALSMHMLEGDWNETHTFVRFEQPAAITETIGYGFGAFLNSEDSVSVFAGLIGDCGRVWWEVGLATGYSGADVVPFGRIGLDASESTRGFIAPAYNVDTGSAGVVFGLEIDLISF